MWRIFGYTKVLIEELSIAELLEIYCEGKPFWWNWFFGWRGTNNKNECYYIIPRKLYEHILIYARKHLGYEIL